MSGEDERQNAIADGAAFIRWTSSDGTPRVDFDHNRALARLLIDEKVGLNRRWWESGKEQEWSIFAICNDVFAWASADVEPVTFDDLQEVYEHHMADPDLGVEKWCIKRRGEMPQKPYADMVKKAGKWDLDESTLRPNAYDERAKS